MAQTLRCFTMSVSLLAVLSLPGCKQQARVPRTVEVKFEVQLINTRGAWGFGRVNGAGRSGSGQVNETINDSMFLSVGVPVFCKVLGEQWDKNDPAHQVLCRVIVDDEEIYMCADQGDPGRSTKAECGGPVYIPQKEKR